MDEETLKAIEARAAAATPGPWTTADLPAEPGDPDTRRYTVINAPPEEGGFDIIPGAFDSNYANEESYREAVRNNEFIAAARTDVPALLAEVRALRAIVDRDVIPDDARLDLAWTRGVLAALDRVSAMKPVMVGEDDRAVEGAILADVVGNVKALLEGR